MKADELFTVAEAMENPDWGFARNKRICLKSRFGELVQSTYSSKIGYFLGPNRDYSYEGLIEGDGGNCFKLLDALLVAIKKNEEFIELTPTAVKAFPWKSIYYYDCSREGKKIGESSVEYYLHKESPVLTVSITIDFEADYAIIKPLGDIRGIYSFSEPLSHSITVGEKEVVVEKNGKKFSIQSDSLSAVRIEKREQHWNYKLGSGERTETEEGTLFKNEERNILDIGEIETKINQSKASVRIFFGKIDKKVSEREDEKKRLEEINAMLKRNSKYLEKWSNLFGRESSRALASRLVCLIQNYGLIEGKTIFPEAGGFWFREKWNRDAVEGIYNNFELYSKEKRKETKELILNLLKSMNNGILSNKQGSLTPAIDATLMCHLLAYKQLKKEREEKLLELLKQKVKETLQAFEGNCFAIVSENGLLKTEPHFSWTDSVVGGRPSRIPSEWVFKSSEEMLSKEYYLVEVNALWIRFLRIAHQLLEDGLKEEAKKLCYKAEKSFKPMFLQKGFPSHITREGWGRSEEISSMGIFAVSFLHDLFSKKELEEIIRIAEDEIFVYRDYKLFGMLCRNTTERIFYDDKQYHGAVCWLKENPYLIRLLLQMGEIRKVEEILLSNLEHQMSEAAIYYNNELLALPEGKNPFPTKESQFPIPVKNPIQYWSQWVQPYFEFLEFI